jgi:hypothetical protein
MSSTATAPLRVPINLLIRELNNYVPPEKKAAKRVGSNVQDIFSGPL